MKVAYLSGPYRAKTNYGIKKNIQRAEDVQVELLQLGYFVINPHKNTAFLGGVVPEEVFIKGDLEFISRLHSGKDIIIMLEGWKDSDGAGQELNWALSLGIHAYYWPKDKQKLREGV